MAVVLHISDTHFGTEQPAVMEALQRLSAALCPDLLILSGDITQRARRGQFAAAAAFVERLGIAARVVVPGNHDIPLFDLAARALAPYRNYRRAFGAELEPSFESPELLVLGVNSTRPRHHTDGSIGAEQIDRVGRRLRGAAARQLRIVVLHHPVRAIVDSDIDNLAHNRETALREWAAAGADLVLGGHIHLPYVRALTTGPRAMWAVQAGTAVSRRTRGRIPNSVNVVRVAASEEATMVSIDRWDFSATEGRFALAESTPLTIDRSSPPFDQ